MVEQWDTEDLSTLRDPNATLLGTNYDVFSNVPPVLTRSWFHTGAFSDVLKLQQKYEQEYWREPGSWTQEGWRALRQTDHLPNAVRIGEKHITYMISTSEAREACRALKGATLHTEVYAMDGAKEQNRPYTVSHNSYHIELIQPLQDNKHAVFMTHTRESITSTYERKLYNIDGRLRADPRISHSVTLAANEFGNTLKAASISYGRRYQKEDAFLSDEDREKQSHVYATYSQEVFTDAIFESDARRLPLHARSESYELVSIMSCSRPTLRSRILTFQEIEESTIAVADGAHDLPHQDFQAQGAREASPYRRLLSASFSLYRRDDLCGALPFGRNGLLAIPYQSYALALSQGQIWESFIKSGKMSCSEVDAVMNKQCGYKRIDGNWWTQSDRTYMSPEASHSALEELEHAKQHFYMPRRAQNAFGEQSSVGYDKYDLLVDETRDAYGNRSTVGQRSDDSSGIMAVSGYDYRLQAPRISQDPNGNRTMYAYDVHGMVVGTAVMGKPEEHLGDNLDSLEHDLSMEDMLGFFSDPISNAKTLHANCTTRSIYDIYAYYSTRDSCSPQPTVVASLAREVHVSDLESGQESRININLAYSDGLGRTFQEKIQAEPGPVTSLPVLRRARKKDRFCQYAGEDQSVCLTRWITSGWTTYNNKGMPVRSYEPFYSRTHQHETDNRLGVSPITFYDGLGRAVGSVGPNHSWSKVVNDPWRVETWDNNDTVLIDNPAGDPDVGGYFRRLPKREYLPTWYQQHAYDPEWPEQRLAAAKAAVHANTPSFGYLDSLGRIILTVTHSKQSESKPRKGGSEEFFWARTTLDVEGKQREIRDNRGRLVSAMTYDYSGAILVHSNMESGTRWALQDINGLSIMRWDERGQRVRTLYDKVRRVERQALKIGERPEIVTSRTVYGEYTNEPERKNHRGRIVKVLDQSGVAHFDQYDFKGNLLTAKSRLGKEFKEINDVSGDTALEDTVYTNSSSYDALNRQIAATGPDESVTRYYFDVAGQIQSVFAQLNESYEETVIVKEIEYDAKGKQIRVEKGNGTSTRIRYDPFNLRLLNVKTLSRRRRRRRTPSPAGQSQESPARDTPKLIQDMEYTYDAVGNLVHARDNAQPCLFFRKNRVHPDQRFTYDSLYRLIEAEGREHLGQSCTSNTLNLTHAAREARPPDHSSNGNAMARYVERYSYDSIGNLLMMSHESDSQHSWTRVYEYNEPSFLEPNQVNIA